MFVRLLALYLLFTGVSLAQQQDLLLRVLLGEAREATVALGVHRRTTAGGALDFTAGTLRISAGPGEVVVAGQGVGPWVELAAPDGFIWNGQAYRGNLLAVWRNGQIAFINRVWLEDYLLGVVPSEVPASFPSAVLQAQAILARTFALYRLNPAGLYDICANEKCQVYRGKAAEQPQHSEAVLATRSLIVSYGQKPITAVYNADSGGYTASAAEVWGNAVPYLVAKPDPYSQSPNGSWSRTLYSATIASALSAMGITVGTVQALQPIFYSESGRPLQLQVVGSAGSVELDGPQSTKLLRRLGLPSTKVRFEGWQVYGQGNGHGVGMSQWGARGLALQGWDYRMILGYYYPGTFLSSFEVVVGLQDQLAAMGYKPRLAQR